MFVLAEFDSTLTAQAALAGGAAIASFFLMRRTRQYFQNHLARPTESSTRPTDSEAGTGPVRPTFDADLNLRQMQTHDLLRELMAELDTKMAALRGLVLMADHARDRLELALQRAEQLGLAVTPDELELIARLPDQSTAETAAALQRLSAAPSATGSSQSPLAEEQVGRLALQGCSPATIAGELGLPLGEVEMLLSLRSGRLEKA